MKKLIQPILAFILMFQTGCEFITGTDSSFYNKGEEAPNVCATCVLHSDESDAADSSDSAGSGDSADAGDGAGAGSEDSGDTASNPPAGEEPGEEAPTNPPVAEGPGNSDKPKDPQNPPGSENPSNPPVAEVPGEENPPLTEGPQLPPPVAGTESCCKPGKVLICHNVTNNPHNICVARAAMNAHLAHLEDYLGKCK